MITSHRRSKRPLRSSALRPLAAHGRVARPLSISDDDLCAGCIRLDYQPGSLSRCADAWPGLVDDDGYIERCDVFSASAPGANVAGEQVGRLPC